MQRQMKRLPGQSPFLRNLLFGVEPREQEEIQHEQDPDSYRELYSVG